MNKCITIAVIIVLSLTLTSCGSPTKEEVVKQKEICDISNMETISNGVSVYCSYRTDPVLLCIKEYTNWIDEKYNNPDTVSNLREDNYSQVVKICKEVFGNK